MQRKVRCTDNPANELMDSILQKRKNEKNLKNSQVQNYLLRKIINGGADTRRGVITPLATYMNDTEIIDVLQGLTCNLPHTILLVRIGPA